MKQIFCLIPLLVLLMPVAFGIITGNETMTRTVPASVAVNSSFQITYTAFNTIGDWGATLVENVTGGCRFISGKTYAMLIMINNPTQTITVIAPPTDGTCTFHGDYKFGSFPIIQFAHATVTIGSGEPTGNSPTVTRTFSKTTVAAGETINITYAPDTTNITYWDVSDPIPTGWTVTVPPSSGFGNSQVAGAKVEDGYLNMFSAGETAGYVASSVIFSWKAPSTAGTYSFNGTWHVETTAGNFQTQSVTVSQPIEDSPTMTRTVPTTAISGNKFTLTYTAAFEDSGGVVIQDSVSGGCTFDGDSTSYNDVMLPDSGTTREITITAPSSPGTCTFHGNYQFSAAEPGQEHYPETWFPDMDVTIASPATNYVSRTFSKTIVAPGESITITYAPDSTNIRYFDFSEQIPAGWTVTTPPVTTGGTCKQEQGSLNCFSASENPGGTATSVPVTFKAPSSTGTTTFGASLWHVESTAGNFQTQTITVTAPTITRTAPPEVEPGETFELTYTAQGVSGQWGASIEDTATGGCTFPSGGVTLKTVMLSEDGLTKTIIIAAPSTAGQCTFHGDYKFGTDPIELMPDTVVNIGTPSCTPSWSCTDWSDCQDGTQTRTCTDTNDCGVTTGKPAESQPCNGNPTITLQQQGGDGHGTAQYNAVELISEYSNLRPRFWYTLIDFTNKDDVTCLGSRKSDSDGQARICADFQANDGWYSNPQNLMLVPTRDVSCMGEDGPVHGQMAAWNPDQYLFS